MVTKVLQPCEATQCVCSSYSALDPRANYLLPGSEAHRLGCRLYAGTWIICWKKHYM